MSTYFWDKLVNVLCFHLEFVFLLFFIKVDIRLAEENLRARRFFDPTSYDKVTAVAQSKLVQAHQSALTSECKQMVQAMKTTGMSKSLASVFGLWLFYRYTRYRLIVKRWILGTHL